MTSHSYGTSCCFGKVFPHSLPFPSHELLFCTSFYTAEWWHGWNIHCITLILELWQPGQTLCKLSYLLSNKMNLAYTMRLCLLESIKTIVCFHGPTPIFEIVVIWSLLGFFFFLLEHMWNNSYSLPPKNGTFFWQ